MIIFNEIGMCVCEMNDLPVPGRLIAITSTGTKKLKLFDEIRTLGKRNFKSEFLEKVFQLLEEIIIY